MRLDGITALDLWDLIVSVFGNTIQTPDRSGQPVVNKREACSPPHTIHKRQEYQRVINDLDNVDCVPSNVQSSHQDALLYVFEDNEAVIKMMKKGRSQTMRHVCRIYRVALDWFHSSRVKFPWSVCLRVVFWCQCILIWNFRVQIDSIE